MNRLNLKGKYTITCFDSEGNVKWEDTAENLVVNEGLEHILDVSLSGATQITTWYIGLTDGTPTVAATDTLASHAGWNEVTDYTEGARQEFVEARTGQTTSNSASKAVFSINATTTVGGAFLTSASTGTTGTLLSAAAFTNGDKSVSSGDTIQVQYDFSATSS